jgi:hypothetical protein
MRKMPGVEAIMPDGINNFMQGASTIGFLWLNLIGAVGVVVVAYVLQLFLKKNLKIS